MTSEYSTNCTNCGKTFYVNQRCKADASNKKKFVRACSKECTSALRSKNMRKITAKGIKRRSGITTTLDRDELIRLICYEHKYLGEVSRILGVNQQLFQGKLKD